MAVVVGLHGPAGSGKDTIGDYMVEHCGWTSKLSFARNLKEMCKAIFYFSDYDVGDQAGKQALFSEPKVFTGRNLGSVMYWMSQTHPQARVSRAAKEAVNSLVGRKLINPRDVLQLVGTDVCRALVPTYHVDVVSKQVESQPEGQFVITDVRFPNEGDLILDTWGGYVFDVDRPDPSAKNINREHPSETAMSDWGRFTATIFNPGDGFSPLYENINHTLRTYLCQDAVVVP